MTDSAEVAVDETTINEAEQAPEQKDIGLMQQSGNIKGFIELQVGDDIVPATFLPELLGDAYGKVLILHSANSTYASHGLVNMLRFSLPEMGWSTMTVALEYPPAESTLYLSVNKDTAQTSEETIDLPDMPQAEERATPTEKSEPKPVEETEQDTTMDPNQVRVATALANLQAHHTAGPTVIIALGEASELANAVIAQIGQQRALIWLDSTMNDLSAVPPVHRILDIVPGLHTAAHLAGQIRRVQMKQINAKQYSQQVISNAGPDFIGLESDVLKRIHVWLHRHYVKRDQ